MLSFCREVDGNVEVADEDGLWNFVKENISMYPALGELFTLNEDALTEHVRKTGEVPPGVKLITKTEVEGQNVTKVRIYHGPTTIPEDDRE